MIARKTHDGWLLVTQHDHALLAGELARHVGNAAVAPVMPMQSVISAVAMHDAGWREYDSHPTLAGDGCPRHAFNMPLLTVLPLWSASVDQAMAADDYTALLVSLHALGLSAYAGTQPRSNPIEVFRLNQFQHRQVEIQENLRRKLQMRVDLPTRLGLADAGRSPEEDLLLRNHHMLQAMDRLSLALCFDRPVFPKIEVFYPQTGGPSQPLFIRRLCENFISLSPWVFAADEVRVTVSARRIKQGRFADDALYIEELRYATVQSIEVSVRRG